jgi:hypothetical protein
MSVARGAAACRKRALDALDRLLEEKNPDSIQQATLTVTRCLVHYRDALIEEARQCEPRPGSSALSHANAVLSLVFGTQYPLEGVHWDRIKKARDAVAALESVD